MQQTTTPLSQYLEPLLSRKKLVVGVAIATMLLGIVVGFLAPTNYRASASVLVSPIDDLDVINSDDADMATELRIAKSRAVADQVAERLNSESITVGADELEDNVAVSNPQDSRILDISYASPSAEQSAKIANTFAEVYVQYRASLASQKIDERKAYLATQIDLLNAQLIEITAEKAGVEAGSRESTDLTIRQQTIQGELSAFQSSLTSLSTIGAGGSEVVDAAQIPSSPEGLGGVQIMFGSLLGGLALGAMAAFAIDAFAKRDKAAIEAKVDDGRRDRRASDQLPPRALPASTGAPVPPVYGGGSDPALPAIAGHGATDVSNRPVEREANQLGLTVPSADQSSADEHATMAPAPQKELGSSFSAVPNYDELLDDLARLGADGPVVILCVTGDGHPETSVAAGLSLAAELHNMGADILVIDTVLHDPVIGPIVGVPESPGLSEVLNGTAQFADAVHPIPVFEEITVLTVGNSTQETYAALNDGSFAEVLSAAREQFHVTVIVGGTINDARISSAVCRLADGLVLAAPVAVGQSLPTELHEELRQLPARTLAVISAGQIGQLLDRSLDNGAQASPSH